MNNKSRHNLSKFFHIYLYILALLVIAAFFIENSFLSGFTRYYSVLLLLLALIPLGIPLVFHKKRKIFIEAFGYFVILSGLLVVNYKLIRDSFPISQIGYSKVVGGIHYHGYPYYYDAIIIHTLLLMPLISIGIVYFRKYLYLHIKNHA